MVKKSKNHQQTNKNVRIKYLCLFLNLIFIFGTVTAILPAQIVKADAPINWTKLTGLGKGYTGGYLTDYHIGYESVSQNGSTILLSSDPDMVDPGTFDIYISRDSGQTWTTKDIGSSVGYASDVELSSDGTILYVLDSDISSLLVSSDFGDTWTTHAVTGAGETDFVSIGSNNTSIVIAGYDSSYVPAIFTSTDSGSSWSTNLISSLASINSVKLAPNNLGIFLVGQDSSSVDHLEVSSDFGVSWVEKAWGDASFSSCSQNPFVLPDNASILTTCVETSTSEKVVRKSTDSGSSWSTVDIGAVVQIDNLDLFVSDDGQTLMALNQPASSSDPSVIYKSTNGGVSWSHFTLGQNYTTYGPFGDSVSGDGSALFLNHQDALYKIPNSGNGATQLTTTGAKLYLFATSDDGYKLIAGGAQYHTSGDHISLVTSTNAGTTWHEQTPNLPSDTRGLKKLSASSDLTKIVISVNNNYGYGYGYIYFSNDSGITWEKISTPIDESPSHGSSWTDIRMSSDGSTIVASRSSGVYVTHDDGQTWSSPTSVIYNAKIAISDNGGKIFLASSDGSRIYLSQDFGATWNNVSIPTSIVVGGDYISSTVLSTSSDGTKLAALAYNSSSQVSLFLSSDSGATWAEKSVENDHTIKGITLSSDGSKLFVLNDNTNLYVSSNDGVSWTEQSFNTSYGNVVVPKNSNLVFVNTSSDYSRGDIYGASIAQSGNTITFSPLSGNGSQSTPTSTNLNAPQLITNTMPTFSGVSAPNASIVVTVHSNPITCSTTASWTGDWSCTLPSNIPPGVHTVLVQSTDPSTSETSLIGPYYVQVLGAATENSASNVGSILDYGSFIASNSLNTTEQSNPTNNDIASSLPLKNLAEISNNNPVSASNSPSHNYLSLLVAIGLLAIGLVVAILLYKKQHKQQ